MIQWKEQVETRFSEDQKESIIQTIKEQININ